MFLHSSGLSSRQWKGMARAFADRHEILTPDFLGMGARPKWPAGAPFHFDADVDLVRALIVRPAHLVGHSYGGLVALTLARRHPELVRSLTVYEPVAFGTLHDPPDPEGLADLARAERMLGALPLEAWLEAFVNYWNGPGAWDGLPESSQRGMIDVGDKIVLEVTSLLGDRTPAGAYASVAAPVLLVRGERSPAAAHRVVARLREALPDATEAIVRGAGHMGPLTHPHEFAELLETHVAST